MILTEEELRDIERNYGFYNATLLKVTASHRELLKVNTNLNGHIDGLMLSLEDREPYYAQQYFKLLSANAELSFKNMKLKELCKKSFNFVDAMESFMGDNLQVMGWHLNGDPEPLENFIIENIDSELWQDLKALTSEESK